ncbi:PIF1, partial [Symbiodinium pilosum]
ILQRHCGFHSICAGRADDSRWCGYKRHVLRCSECEFYRSRLGPGGPRRARLLGDTRGVVSGDRLPRLPGVRCCWSLAITDWLRCLGEFVARGLAPARSHDWLLSVRHGVQQVGLGRANHSC